MKPIEIIAAVLRRLGKADRAEDVIAALEERGWRFVKVSRDID